MRGINKLPGYVRDDENGFVKRAIENPAMAHLDDVKKAKRLLSKNERRIDEIDKLFTRIYEDNVMGKIDDEQYKYSCDEDFRNTGKLNYAKNAHNEHYNHPEAGLKKVSMEDIKKEQLAANEELEQELLCRKRRCCCRLRWSALLP